MRVTSYQLRAARAMAGLTVSDLAKRAKVSRDTIEDWEAGKVTPQKRTVENVWAILSAEGVELVGDRGVRLADDTVKIIEGENAYLRMLDDIYYATQKPGGEVLWMCSSDAFEHPGENEAEIRLREAGIKFRSLVEEGKIETIWPRNEYRQIPSRYFNHNLMVIYSDKVAQVLDEGKRVLIVHNASLAITQRNMFDLIWSLMPPPPKKDN